MLRRLRRTPAAIPGVTNKSPAIAIATVPVAVSSAVPDNWVQEGTAPPPQFLRQNSFASEFRKRNISQYCSLVEASRFYGAGYNSHRFVELVVLNTS